MNSFLSTMKEFSFLKIGQSLNHFLMSVGRAMRYSWLSILIVALVFLLMTQMDQGATIYIDILDGNWLNILLFYYLLSSLAFITSHYPVYVEKSLTSNSGKWLMDKKSSFLGFGFITYTSEKNSDSESKSLVVDASRKFMGIMLIAVIIYIGLFVHFENIVKPFLPWDTDREIGKFEFLLTLISVSVPFVIVFLIKRHLLNLEKEGNQHLIVKTKLVKSDFISLNKIGKLLNIFSLFLFLFSVVATLYSVMVHKWSQPTYVLFQVSLFCLSFYYSCFRFFRRNSLLSNDIKYLQYLSLSGFTSIVILLLGHYKFELFNPFIIFLAQLNVIYGLVIIPKKHVLYYKQKQFNNSGFGLPYYFRNIHVFVPIILVLWLLISDGIGNDLHLIKTLKQDKEVEYDKGKFDDLVDMRRFTQEADKHFATKDKLFYIASYGGGMKANIWNMLLLDTLSNYGGEFNILENTLAMSGVSGGALGHSMFTGLRYAKGDGSFKKEIREFGYKNLVSSDLTLVLGRDLLFEFVPGNLFNKAIGSIGDREQVAIKRHDEFVDNRKFMSNKTYQVLWSELFHRERAKGSFYPMLIGNAAGTNTKRGVATSVYMAKRDFSRTFFNSVDLTKFNEGGQSISFFSVPSISNRFPIFSPAAKLQKKGHFIDGGYFENSGMLSVQDMADALTRNIAEFQGEFGNSQDSTQIYQKHDSEIYFVQIANGRDEYLQRIISPYEIKMKVKEASELSSILSTVTSISFIPSYIQDKLRMRLKKKDSHYIELQLPYFIYKKDLENLITGDIEVSDLNPKLITEIQESNRKLLQMFGHDMYKYTQPPLARMLGRQSVAYMEKVIKEGEIFNELNKEIKWPEK